jgi:hypothetical protein
MDNVFDPQIPGSSSTWQLWYSDTFDLDDPPSVQISGTDIVQGLYELWFHTLNEAVLDNGNASFSRFHLRWGNTASTRVDIYVKPFNNPSLLRLRQWARHAFQNQSGEEEVQGKAILWRLAQLHYELLQKSNRWQASTIDWSAESKEILVRVEACQEAGEL